MKRANWVFIIALAVIVTLLASPFTAMAAPPFADDSLPSDRILVKFHPGVDEATQSSIHRKYGGQVVDTIPALGVKVVSVPFGRALERVRSYLGERAVRYAEVDAIAHAVDVVPNDPYYANQWALPKIQAPAAWGLTTGKPGVKIAILDTGIDQDHPDLSKIVANRNFTTSRTVDDRYGHGTHVAGIAAAATNNGIGVAGVGYNSSLMNVKVLGDNGSGYYSWIANGITWAADNGARVINLSLGGSTDSSTLKDAVDHAWGKGAVVVAAAGNSNTNTPFYPAAYTNAIAVAATDQNDAKASFSNYGSWVDLAAPGVSIYSTLPNHNNRIGTKNYGYLSGTSMASPHVAGLAALIFAKYQGISNADVRARIQNNTDATTGFSPALGRINAYNALQ